jgi:sulfite reductase alpha subunit-like flavoprotein
VDALLERLNWTQIADTPLLIQSSSSDQPIPEYLLDNPTTLRTLLTSVLDITAVPRKSFFELLRHFTQDSLETEKLQEFTSLSAEGPPIHLVYMFSADKDPKHRSRRLV